MIENKIKTLAICLHKDYWDVLSDIGDYYYSDDNSTSMTLD